MNLISSIAKVPDNLDLTDPLTHLRPDIDNIWRQLRRDSPVAWHAAVNGLPGFWVVSTHELVMQVYRDSQTFTSVHGNVMATLLYGGDSAGGRMLAVSDGDRHRQIRKELLKSFSPKNLMSVQKRIKHAMHELVRNAVRSEQCDFATDVAPHIPLAAICDILKIPESDRAKLFANASTALASNSLSVDELDTRLARNELLMYFYKCIQTREIEPLEDDLISNLIALTQGSLALTQEELVFNCYSILLGGDETTRLALIGIVKTFAENPECWAQLQRGEAEVSKAVEELLRWTTPALHGGRTATVDIELGGQQIRAGDVVTVWNRSANFDETIFTKPEVLDLNRTDNRHLSFAYGAHFCLGAALARIEITALLEALLALVDEISLSGEPSPIYSTFLSGYHHLPVKLVAANCS
ncbi:cytochrome P450 [Xenorhabdus sp. 12]|uniref:Cytochrome P450 n=1 Tax=Xenorhabdus santafensis TaxID=2582833 RepID=A0ABU4S744_9GAMM|nr:cytochrome P450 [Xenorhabdus sp. 12]MDX7986718.1 cytochrome P450 [Xenorhabdus sp. 12]